MIAARRHLCYNMVMSLLQKHCVPCEGGATPLTGEELNNYVKAVSGWQIDGDKKKIKREFAFKNFSQALAFVNKIGALAESENHHPDVLLHGYKHVTITLSTHAIGGLSENDFILAAKINKLLIF